MEFKPLLRSLLLASPIVLGLVTSLPAAPGDLDQTFGMGGIVTTHVVPASLTCACHNRAKALALQLDGKIVAAGETTNVFPTSVPHGDFAVARYNQDGSLAMLKAKQDALNKKLADAGKPQMKS